jgi:hypothetical protein
MVLPTVPDSFPLGFCQQISSLTPWKAIVFTLLLNGPLIDCYVIGLPPLPSGNWPEVTDGLELKEIGLPIELFLRRSRNLRKHLTPSNHENNEEATFEEQIICSWTCIWPENAHFFVLSFTHWFLNYSRMMISSILNPTSVGTSLQESISIDTTSGPSPYISWDSPFNILW